MSSSLITYQGSTKSTRHWKIKEVVKDGVQIIWDEKCGARMPKDVFFRNPAT